VAIKGGAKLRGKGTQVVRPGERLVVMTPGGGGLGAPEERDAALVEQDRREERAS
jgi:N-methylhydantoinase B